MTGELIAGGAVALAGVGLGVIIGRLPRWRRIKDPKPICGCGHHYSMHDLGTGRCYDKLYLGYDNPGGRYAQCSCRKYTGPEPLPTYTAQIEEG